MEDFRLEYFTMYLLLQLKIEKYISLRDFVITIHCFQGNEIKKCANTTILYNPFENHCLFTRNVVRGSR